LNFKKLRFDKSYQHDINMILLTNCSPKHNKKNLQIVNLQASKILFCDKTVTKQLLILLCPARMYVTFQRAPWGLP
jgi:hypothetical protein